MAVIRAFLGKHIITLLVAVIVSLALTAKVTLDRKEAIQRELTQAEQIIERTQAELAQERRNARALTDAIEKSQRRSQALAEANQALSDEVSRAIRQNPAWGSTRTPDAVVDSLCQSLNCGD